MLIDLAHPGPLLQVINGDLYFYDNTRTKLLSSSTSMVTFGIDHKNIQSNRYMAMTSGIYSNTTGYRVIKNATIISMSVQTDNLADCFFRIRKNKSITNLTSLALSSQSGNNISNLNINIDQGEYIQCYLDITSGNVDYPELIVNYSWRQ